MTREMQGVSVTDKTLCRFIGKQLHQLRVDLQRIFEVPSIIALAEYKWKQKRSSQLEQVINDGETYA